MIPVLRPEEIALSMRRGAEVLTPFSFPRVPPSSEDVISILKQRVVEIDGVEVVVFFNRCEYPGPDWKVETVLETLQIYPKNSTFLSFRISCKLARLFFGDEVPGVTQLVHPSERAELVRRMVVWSVYRNAEGKVIPIDKSPVALGATKVEYEGYKFFKLNDQEMVFF